ncbi:MAG: sensor domain-containing diguanylate cyclase [Bacteroidales bacterium]|nr:sensor domain-containing diguanylate cyclase [Bacteroidales bacterium]
MNIFKDRQFGLAFFLIVVSYIASFLISFQLLRSVTLDNSVQLTHVLATRIYEEINNELSKPINVSLTMANDLFMIERLQEEDKYSHEENVEAFRTYLSRIKKGFGYEAAFIVSEKSKNYYTFQGFNKVVDVENDAHDIWYKLFIDKDVTYDLDVDVNEVKNNNWTVFFNTRIEDGNGHLLGCCGVGEQMDNLQELFYNIERKHGVKINLVNGDGLVQVDVNEINIENSVLDGLNLSKHNSEEYVIEYHGDNFYVTKYVENLGWFLVIRNTENFTGAAYSQLFIFFLILLVVLLIILGVSIYMMMKGKKTLVKASNEDKLTNMLNRNAYETRIQGLLGHSIRNITFVSIDVNGLKKVNDTLGHSAGDELICGAAQCIRSYFGNQGLCYRLGGDEFAVILSNCEHESQQIINEFHELVDQWQGTYVKKLSISMGVVRSSDYESVTIEKLVEYADMAMYREKEAFYEKQKTGQC